MSDQQQGVARRKHTYVADHQWEQAMRQSCVGSLVLAAALVAASPFVYAQGRDIGKQEYLSKCAACHGKDAKGDGPVAGSLKVKVPDLTVLAKNSGGVFPFARVYDVIDGREAVAAHGAREMLVWGNEYWQEGGGASGGEANQQELGSYARGRIVALIGYIFSLQVK
jgi:mono/diheme cytochrome c family protein